MYCKENNWFLGFILAGILVFGGCSDDPSKSKIKQSIKPTKISQPPVPVNSKEEPIQSIAPEGSLEPKTSEIKELDTLVATLKNEDKTLKEPKELEKSSFSQIFDLVSEPENSISNEEKGLYPGKIKVGHLIALDMAPLFVAKEANYFKDVDVDLDLETVFFSNPSDNNAALSSGSIQFSTNPFTLSYLGENNGFPIRIVSSAGGFGTVEVVIQGNYIVDSLPVDSLQKLAKWVKDNPAKKLKIGSLRGDTLDMILFHGFEKVGLKYDDFEMIWFNDLLAMNQSFKSKDIDILSHIKPYTTDLIANYNAKRVTDSNEVWGYGTPNCTVSVLQEFADKYPETVKRYLKALKRGFDLILKEPEKAAELLMNGNYFGVSKDVLLMAFKHQKEILLNPKGKSLEIKEIQKNNLKPSLSGMNKAIKDMVLQNYIKKIPETNVFLPGFLGEIS
jgi:ABC-type nitrate/sulfonate/bicarbonate transport system substrate-binding protein